MVYSSSSIHSLQKFDNSLYYVHRQAIRIMIGLGVMTFFAFVDYRYLASKSFWLCGIFTLMLILVFVPGIGVRAGGGLRWIDLFVRIQPSEYFKVFYILFLSYSLARIHLVEQKFVKVVLPHLGFLGFVFALVVLQPDLSTALLIALIGILMILTVYTRPWLILTIALVGSMVVGYQIYKTPYRLNRVLAFMNPGEHERDYGYQVLQSKISLGSGGVAGLGLGQSRQKFFYLPEEHTDFIFAIIGEEFGFVGSFLILLLYFVFLIRGLKVARRAPDLTGQLIAIGVTGFLTFQVLINLMVVVGLIPPTGIPLPFLSYGGSSMISSLIGVGILLNISSHCSHSR